MKRPSLTTVLGLVCLLLTNTSLAQVPDSARRMLALDDVLSSVEKSFPLLRAAELERAVAEGETLSSRGGFDIAWKTKATLKGGYYDSLQVDSVVEQPTSLWGVSLIAGYRLGVGEFPSYDGNLQTLDRGEVRGGLHVPLWKNGPIDRRRANVQKAKLGGNIAELSVAEQRIQILRAATHRYWAWVAAGQRLRIAEELLRNVEGRSAALAARVARGDLAKFEQIDNERAVQQRRAQVALAYRGLEQAALELGLYLRDAAGAPSPPAIEQLPEEFSPLDVEQEHNSERHDLATAWSNRPEAKKLELQMRQNQVEHAFTKNQLAPAVDVQVLGSQDLGRARADRPDLSEPTAQLTVQLDIPLQNRLMRGRADALAAHVARLRHQTEFAKDRIEAEVRDARSGIARALERIESARREIELAVELESLERTRFEQGDSHLLIVNLREQQTAEAELRQVDALLDYRRAAADLVAARGG